MGSEQSVLQASGYELVSEQNKMMLVKNKDGDQFVVKKLNANEDDVSNFLQKLNHPHIVQHKEIIREPDSLYVLLDHCEGGDLAEITKLQEKVISNEILDRTVKICMALKHLHDQQILHKNLQPKSIFFTACGTIRLGEFGQINEWSADAQTTETKAISYVAPENLNGRPFDEKSEIWSLGCVIYEMCMRKCAFTAISTVEIITKILNCSYKALPKDFSEDLHQLVKDTLQIDPANRPSVSEILMRPFIINHLYEKSTQTIKELYGSLDVLEKLADGFEKVHYNTTVGSLAGGVVGLAGGITSIVGLILTPFTLGASLIVTGVGIGVAVAGGVASGASNITKMVNQRTDRQKIKMIITELQEKITFTSSCIQNIQIAVITQKVLSERGESWSNDQSGADFANIGARLGRGLGGIAELIRLAQVSSVGRVAAQTARAVRVAEAATGVLTGLFVAVDAIFVALDSKEIHNLRRDYASIATQQESEIAATITQSKSNQTTGSTKDEAKLQELRQPNLQPRRTTLIHGGPPKRFRLHTDRKVLDDNGKTTSVGKTTLINTMVNYLMGVKFENEIWYEITEEESNQKPIRITNL
ncbi:calcium/calmodulin-dependent protein kinase type 1D [Pimephales promelas]|nr:calcium/calmodulin-dependent protein kinase type 1D [Pimephales promelas]